MVVTAASIAQAASTALPPRANIMAPAVAPRGLPVMAIQCRAWRGGFWVGWRCWAAAERGIAESTASARPSRDGTERMALMLAAPSESRQRRLHLLGPPRSGALLRPLAEAVHLPEAEGELPGGLRPLLRVLSQAGQHQVVECARDRAGAAARRRLRRDLRVADEQGDRILRGEDQL